MFRQLEARPTLADYKGHQPAEVQPTQLQKDVSLSGDAFDVILTFDSHFIYILYKK